MLTSIDRFVLSKVEKFTQYLQRYFGIKLTSVINLAGGLIVITFFMKWYFLGFPAGPILIFELPPIIGTLTYVYVFSPIHQRLIDKWATNRVSNPLKGNPKFGTMRSVLILESIFFITLVYFTTKEFLLRVPETLFYLTLVPPYLTFVYTVSVDALPPGTKKEESWLKNLFQKLSPTT